MKPLVSIIIPTYNRAHLIGETLDSVLAQIYQEWECIVVDDGSSDYTKELLEFYSDKDNRIQFYYRPRNRLKGANACRNYGFEISRGEYIQWFDSDDIMLPRKLKIQLGNLLENNFNFCVAKFDNYINNTVFKEKAFDKNLNNVVNGENYALINNFWGTIDALISRDLISDIRFNEDLESGQEYNFFVKLLMYRDCKLIYLNRVFSLRRLHTSSIQGKQSCDSNQYLFNKYTLFYQTYNEIKCIKSKKVILFMLKNCQSLAFRISLLRKIPPHMGKLIYILIIEIGIIKTLLFSQSIILGLLFKKGYMFSKKSHPAIKTF